MKFTECSATPEDAEILRRVDPSYRGQARDWSEGIRMSAMMRLYPHPVDRHHRLLAAQGFVGQEWLDVMDEMRGAA